MDQLSTMDGPPFAVKEGMSVQHQVIIQFGCFDDRSCCLQISYLLSVDLVLPVQSVERLPSNDDDILRQQ